MLLFSPQSLPYFSNLDQYNLLYLLLGKLIFLVPYINAAAHSCQEGSLDWMGPFQDLFCPITLCRNIMSDVIAHPLKLFCLCMLDEF